MTARMPNIGIFIKSFIQLFDKNFSYESGRLDSSNESPAGSWPATWSDRRTLPALRQGRNGERAPTLTMSFILDVRSLSDWLSRSHFPKMALKYRVDVPSKKQ
jgi:hypothetical protein